MQQETHKQTFDRLVDARTEADRLTVALARADYKIKQLETEVRALRAMIVTVSRGGQGGML
jgi:hypothetical protein